MNTATETETDDDSVIVVTSSTDPNQTLQLDCYEEELSETQKMMYDKALEEHNSVMTKLKEVINDAQNIFSGEVFSAYQILGPVPGIEDISKPISSFNKKEPRREKSRKRDYVESEEDEDNVPLSKRKAKERKKEKKNRSNINKTPASEMYINKVFL